MNQHGFNWELEQQHRAPEDWEHGISTDKQPLLGAQITWDNACIPKDVREHYLPQGELQNIGSEKYDCATRAPLNILETKFNYLLTNNLLPLAHHDFLEHSGYLTSSGIQFSDAWISIKAGTTKAGNSLIKPCQTIKQSGLIPKTLLSQVADFDAYYDPKRITPKLEALAHQFKRYFKINYIRVYAKDYAAVREKDMIDVGGFAWPEPENGVYYSTNEPFNHAYVNLKPDIIIFDNYLDTDGDFLKQLAPDYLQTPYGYRLVLTLLDPANPRLLGTLADIAHDILERFFGNERLGY